MSIVATLFTRLETIEKREISKKIKTDSKIESELSQNVLTLIRGTTIAKRLKS